jgi:2-polyprenyl-3-methyl-5-hydroxy-6-metoxy-1,4-benzoquinol methylase
MAALEGYFKYTVCNQIPAGIKRLRFIVDSIARFRGERSPDQVSILDYGCGNGYFTIAIACLGYKIDGVDIDLSSIEFARKKNPFDNAKFYQIGEGKNSLAEVFEGKKYDVVVSSEVLHWTKEPHKYLALARERLKEKGILILTDENAFGPREILGRIEQVLLDSKVVRSAIKKVREKMGMISTESRKELYSANPDIIKRQLAIRHNFQIYSIRRLFYSEGFEILKERNSFFIFAVFGLGGKTRLDQWDCKLADYLPRFIVSGWYFILRPTHSTTQ